MADFAKNITDSCTIPKMCRERFLPLKSYEESENALIQSGIFFSGVSELVQDYRIARASPNFHLIILGVGGRGVFMTEEKQGTIESGDVWICPARTSQLYYADGNWKILFFHIDEHNHEFGNIFEKVQLGLSRSASQLENAMIGLINEFQKSGEIAQQLAMKYSEIIKLCLDRELASILSPDLTRNTNRLDGLWQEVGESLSLPWTLDELAQRMHTSTAQLRRIVQQHHQMAPMEMVQMLRIQKSKQLLKTTNDSLEQIAERVGYTSPFSFSRAFKKNTGISPREYRTQSKLDPYRT